MQTVTYRVRGMDCAEEVATLGAVLSPKPDVKDLAFDVLNGRLTATYSEQAITPDELVTAIARTGMQAEPWQ
jgi:Cd2+/Zn2+-exporting ATPase